MPMIEHAEDYARAGYVRAVTYYSLNSILSPNPRVTHYAHMMLLGVQSMPWVANLGLPLLYDPK